MAHYFISDIHLGILDSVSRERHLISWLDSIKEDCEAIYLVGDTFDYWHEYNRVIPNIGTRLLGKLAELSDNGVEIHMFKGNHDMWMYEHFTKEFGAIIHDDDYQIELFGRKLFIHHGDGLGPGDKTYKLLKKVFRSRLCQWLFARIHPNFGIWLMQRLSRLSRDGKNEEVLRFDGEDEWLVQFVKENHEKIEADYYLFGHRHIPFWVEAPKGEFAVINLGDWIKHNSYVRMHRNGLFYGFFESEHKHLHKINLF